MSHNQIPQDFYPTSDSTERQTSPFQALLGHDHNSLYNFIATLIYVLFVTKHLSSREVFYFEIRVYYLRRSA